MYRDCKKKFKYQFTGLTILGCLAAIYILYMYLKRINKKNLRVYVLKFMTLFLIIGVRPQKVPGVGVGVVVFRMQRVGAGVEFF